MTLQLLHRHRSVGSHDDCLLREVDGDRIAFIYWIDGSPGQDGDAPVNEINWRSLRYEQTFRYRRFNYRHLMKAALFSLIPALPWFLLVVDKIVSAERRRQPINDRMRVLRVLTH